MPPVVARLIEIGPLFARDTAPDLHFHLLWDAGGYVDLTDATVACNIRRWDPFRKVPLGGVVTSGSCTIDLATRGECAFVWTAAAPVASVPVDPGWYVAQVEVTFPLGAEQESQRAIFEVLPGSA